MKFSSEISKVIDKKMDFVSIVKLMSGSAFEEESIGEGGGGSESIIIDF